LFQALALILFLLHLPLPELLLGLALLPVLLGLVLPVPLVR
jgi:hypothetical protein